MDKDIKKITLTSPAWEFKRIVDICNEQSKQGYQLEKLKLLSGSIFKKDESKRYIYDADFNTVILRKGKARENYLEMFSEQGWEFLDNTFNGFSMFRKEYVEGTPKEDYKIYTDVDTSKELYNRMEVLLKTVLMIVIPIEILLMGKGSAVLSVLSDFSVVQFLIMFLVLMIISCLQLTLFICGGLKAIKKIKN